MSEHQHGLLSTNLISIPLTADTAHTFANVANYTISQKCMEIRDLELQQTTRAAAHFLCNSFRAISPSSVRSSGLISIRIMSLNARTLSVVSSLVYLFVCLSVSAWPKQVKTFQRLFLLVSFRCFRFVLYNLFVFLLFCLFALVEVFAAHRDRSRAIRCNNMEHTLSMHIAVEFSGGNVFVLISFHNFFCYCF